VVKAGHMEGLLRTMETRPTVAGRVADLDVVAAWFDGYAVVAPLIVEVLRRLLISEASGWKRQVTRTVSRMLRASMVSKPFGGLG
jgi:hypothetical protein